MRIVGGKYRSVRFKPPKAFNSRPTTNFAKEGIFNVLLHRVDLNQKQVLDLFCGTGNISFEFLSHGAKVTAVDVNFKCLKYIKGVAQKLDAISDICPVRMDVNKFISESEDRFDIVFMDPPFDTSNYKDMIDEVLDKPMLNTEGILIVEHHKKVDLSHVDGFEVMRKYGSVCFSIFS
jgi:16S rRNA (guanine(966)-N(2))-methyltransferase RsmD